MENNTNIKTCMFVYLDKAAVHEAYWSYIVNIVFNSSLALPTVIFNVIVLAAIWKTSSLHTPSHMFIFSLSMSDLLIGLITEPFYVSYMFSEKQNLLNNKFDEYCDMGVQVFALFSIYFLAAVSFATLTAMSIDRYLAIHLGMRYPSVVTPSRVAKTLVVVWLCGVFAGSLRLFLHPKEFSKVVSAVIALFLTIMSFAYIKAFSALKKHQSQMAAGTNQSPMSKIHLERYKRTLYTVLYILGLILLCYVPHFCVFIVISAKGINSSIRAAVNMTTPFVLANSCLNPLLYWWKMKELRRASRNIFKKVFGLKNNSFTSTDNAGSNKLTSLPSSGEVLESLPVSENKALDTDQSKL